MDVVVFSQRLKTLSAGDEGFSPDEFKEVLRKIQTDFEPTDHNGSRVLITSKDFNVGTNWDACHLDIGRLSEEDSQEMLLDRVFIKEGSQLEIEPVINSLRNFCRGWPLDILCISGFDIFTWHLYQLWIAEGFIHHNSEATAEEYLKELIATGFVQVEKRTSGGRIKTYNINGYTRDILFSIMVEKHICTFKVLCPISLFTLLPWLEKQQSGPDNHVSENFKLRLLDLGALVLQQHPTGIETSFLLRYLKLNIPSLTRVLSELCNNLLNLYTLDMPNGSTDDTTHDIWKMHKLRRLNFKLIKLPAHPGKYCNSLENLNFISTLHPSSCTQGVLSRLPNLPSLRIHGNLSSYQSTLSESLCKPLNLESLMLVNKSENSMISAIKLSEYQFPPQLTQLSMPNTELKDDPVPTLEKLQHLIILKQNHNSYIGRKLASTSGGFLKLRVLHLKSMLWLEKWDNGNRSHAKPRMFSYQSLCLLEKAS
ncbi:probable disease resistance protein At1g58390 [Mangifera indica]|uniref:probable disease resistance protein At1g58390 n=1 Tax=Mangifera indica TaxID=29780 RepID=UPI001CF9944D|nr:probable disease resistance protein At1g58390 [Mangifera indica]